ncbi:MAG: transcription termination factor Rho [Planctomycetes bacterium]|nr:transcription termination factor Rho [Planctomycetota bacterium]
MSKRHRPRHKHFKFNKPHGGAGGPPGGGHGGGFHPAPRGAGATLAVTYEEVRVDPAVLPADLDEAAWVEFEAQLPPAPKRGKKKASAFHELQALTLSELHELAEAEELGKTVENLSGKKRGELVFEIARARLLERAAMTTVGLAEVQRDGYAFLRIAKNSYLASAEDVFVPPSLVQRYGMRTGMTVEGELRPPRDSERVFCLHSIASLDHRPPEQAATRTPFRELVPLYPTQRLTLEGSPDNPIEMRIMDLVAPIGRGQRALIVAPPRTGKTVLLQQIARSIVANAPDVHLIILLVDERPEEVTDMERTIPGTKREVVSSTFDEPAARHLKVADMVIQKARCLVEAGHHVAILLDSITRLARAANNEAPANGKLLSGGIEATALQFPKRFFGSARNIEDGGSLTILGTALIETGSKMDEVIFEEFKGTGNSELVLDRRLSDRRIFPAIDINRSGTRKEELLFTKEEMPRIYMLHKVLNEMDPVESMETLIQKVRRTQVNGQFLMSIGS